MKLVQHPENQKTKMIRNLSSNAKLIMKKEGGIGDQISGMGVDLALILPQGRRKIINK